MSVVAKMVVHEVPAGESITGEVQKVRLGAVYEPDADKRAASENAIFGKATPWGEIVLGIANPGAKQFFEQGQQYYVTFTKAPPQ